VRKHHGKLNVIAKGPYNPDFVLSWKNRRGDGGEGKKGNTREKKKEREAVDETEPRIRTRNS